MEIIENYIVLKFSNLSISMCVGYMHVFVVVLTMHTCTRMLPVDTYTCQRGMAGVYYCSLPYSPVIVSPIAQWFFSSSGWPVSHCSVTISSHLPHQVLRVQTRLFTWVLGILEYKSNALYEKYSYRRSHLPAHFSAIYPEY